MTDSIPQQAGQLAVVPQHAYDALVQELTNIAQADPSKWDPEMRGEFRSWAQSRARFALSHLAAPLAVEDSRERCALTDESIDTLLASVGPTQGMRPDSRDLTLAQVRKLVRAAMAAASSGKEKME